MSEQAKIRETVERGVDELRRGGMDRDHANRVGREATQKAERARESADKRGK